MSTTQQTPGGLKYETFVEGQLGRASLRVRFLDLMVASLGVVGMFLAYGLLVAVLDRWLELPAFFRQIAFLAFLGVVCFYLTVTAVRPVFHRVNPYYAALQMEHAVPMAKNSLVSWLDIREREVPRSSGGRSLTRLQRTSPRQTWKQPSAVG